jgi:hypothetical protein
MEKYNNRKDKVDILSLHTDLGGVEMIVTAPPKDLVFQALLTDPQFLSVTSYQLKGIEGAAQFFDVVVEGRVLTLHQTVISRLYRIENFVIKRNYYYSQDTGTSTAVHETLVDTGQSVNQPISQRADYTSYNQSNLSHGSSSSKDESRHINWGDVEDETDLLGLNQSLSYTTVGTRKNLNLNFLDENFLNGLPAMGQTLVPYNEYKSRNKGFEKHDFYMFDFVAMFMDPKNLFENQRDFKITYIKSKLDLLNDLFQKGAAHMPLQTDNTGWNSMTKFLCQSLNGEYQVSFLKVCLFFSLRKVLTRERILSSVTNDEVVTFLTSDELIKYDCSRIIRLNPSALANNQKVLIDKAYAENCVTPVEDTE